MATQRLADATPVGGPARRGRVIAVWGPAGAPGRSTVAMGLADRVVAAGSSAVLIDADVYGGVLANAFGLLDESAGLAGACRLASNGRLGPADFAGLCWQVRDRLILMTGIARADRWPELRPSAIPMVLDTARTFADVVIVDCSSVVESDEEITFDTLAPRRNGATLAVLEAADSVIAVGAADPAGMERLARGYADVTAAVAGLEPKIVFNRVRATAASVPELREASRRFCGSEPIAFLPEDRAVVDLAWQRGVALSMVKSKSPLVRAFDDLVRAVAVTPSGR
jgi:MinD-like ATPase involved in chromosome partitioning or flagellar assembly